MATALDNVEEQNAQTQQGAAAKSRYQVVRVLGLSHGRVWKPPVSCRHEVLDDSALPDGVGRLCQVSAKKEPLQARSFDSLLTATIFFFGSLSV